LLLALLLPVAGCRHNVARIDDRDEENRLLVAAREKVDEGDYESAVVLLKKALDVHPDIARTHLDLALLLHDRSDQEEKKRNYVAAIYHYQRYLELRPATEKREMIGTRTRQAVHAFAVLSGETPDDNAARRIAGLENTNALLTEETDKLEGRNEALRKEAAELRVRAGRLEKELMELREKLGVLEALAQQTENTAGKPAEKPVAVRPPAASSVAEVSRTYTVQPRDSLSRIAQKVYGNAADWEKIQVANREALGNSVDVQVGQVLVIP